MSSRGAKKTGGFFQKLFGSDSSPSRKVKEVKKDAPKPADLPQVVDPLQIETTDETQSTPNVTSRSTYKTGKGKGQPQATARAAVKSSSQSGSVVSRLSTPGGKSSTQAGATTKTTTQPGTATKSTTQTGAAVKGSSRTCSEPGRRNTPAKSGSASTSGTRLGKTASGGARPSRHPRTSGTKRCQRRRKKKPPAAVKVDTSRPLEFPTTPEMILAFHTAKPFLSKTEEWVVVSLNEYECMVDNLDVIRTMGKHSQFFEVEPEELCEEFFEYVEDVPSYDEVINADIWQEFRYEKYNW